MKNQSFTILFISLIAIMLSACAIGAQASPEIGQVAPVQQPPHYQENAETKNPEAPLVLTMLSYPIVDSGQTTCLDNQQAIDCPRIEGKFNGQDAQYAGSGLNYVDNGDGTISDLTTGLMWQKIPGEKVTYGEALGGAENMRLAGYGDWRVPTIKDLYSLIDFSGQDPSGWEGTDTSIPVHLRKPDWLGACLYF